MAGITMGCQRRGISTVEAAIILPLLVLLTMGLIEYGWLFLSAQQTTNAARQGARIGATADATSADVNSAVSVLMADAGMAEAGYSVVIDPVDITVAEPGSSVTVTVAVPAENVRITGFPLPMPANLRASVSMAKEGP